MNLKLEISWKSKWLLLSNLVAVYLTPILVASVSPTNTDCQDGFNLDRRHTERFNITTNSNIYTFYVDDAAKLTYFCAKKLCGSKSMTLGVFKDNQSIDKATASFKIFKTSPGNIWVEQEEQKKTLVQKSNSMDLACIFPKESIKNGSIAFKNQSLVLRMYSNGSCEFKIYPRDENCAVDSLTQRYTCKKWFVCQGTSQIVTSTSATITTTEASQTSILTLTSDTSVELSTVPDRIALKNMSARELMKLSANKDNFNEILQQLENRVSKNPLMISNDDVSVYLDKTINTFIESGYVINDQSTKSILEISSSLCNHSTLATKAHITSYLSELPRIANDTRGSTITSSSFTYQSKNIGHESEHVEFRSSSNNEEPSIRCQLHSDQFSKNQKVSFMIDESGCLNPTTQSGITKIVSVSVLNREKKEIKDLKNNNGALLEITFTHAEKKPRKILGKSLLKMVNQFQCAFYNMNGSYWSTYGLTMEHNDDDVICKSSHLTNFALIMTPVPMKFHPGLDITSKVALSLSIICLLIVIVFNLKDETSRTNRPIVLLINICTNLLLVYILFLFGVKQTHHGALCGVVAVLLHYAMLVTWCWMTIYSYDLYFTLVKVFGPHRSNFLRKSFACAYTLPLIFVLIWAAVGFSITREPLPFPEIPDHVSNARIAEANMYLSDGICWLHTTTMYYGLILPVSLLLLFNLFIYALVMKSLMCVANDVDQGNIQRTAKDGFVLGSTFALTTGLTWAFAVLLFLSEDETYLLVVSWLFTITNATQGILIFILACFRNQRFKKRVVEPTVSFIRKPIRRIHFFTLSESVNPTNETKLSGEAGCAKTLERDEIFTFEFCNDVGGTTSQ